MATAEQQRSTDIQVENPATGEVVGSVATVSVEELHAMAERGRAAQPAWEALGFDGRAKVLRRAQKWTTDNAERIAKTIVAESGKTYEDALLAEVAYAANAFGFWAKHAPAYLGDERVRSANPFVLGRKLVVRYRPLGLVGVIGPWNYPLTNSFGDCIPAMAAGNAVILKPAEVTPMTSLLMQECMRECGLPEGIYQVAQGSGSTLGPELIDLADMVMFTGSTETGKKIMERASRTLTPVSLELGGKDPMIVLADADIERAANAATYYSMQNGGQTCISVERVYVEAPIYDEFVRRVAEKVGALRQGVPGGAGTYDMGAITNPPQVELISRHVDEAKAAGARVLTGGHAREGKGHFYEPTVLVDVDHSMSAMTEETFGPTLPIMKVADADEAIRLANDSDYGLSSSLWTRDRRRADQLSRRIEAGSVSVNNTVIATFQTPVPMGGWKQSGLGTRFGGANGVLKYCRQQSVVEERIALTAEPNWYPVVPAKSEFMAKVVRFLGAHDWRRKLGRSPR
jgi:acyl-CoA reductase-like NAD-dependent aldehyde dehydrogenase